jgi:hypothetical protein
VVSLSRTNPVNLTLDAVEKTLREDFLAKGFRHYDIAWRNVGIYYDDGKTEIVVFDMRQVRVENRQDDWVCLRSSLFLENRPTQYVLSDDAKHEITVL